MMRKRVLILSSILLLSLGCRTKKVLKVESREKETIQYSQKKSESEVVEQKAVFVEQKKESEKIIQKEQKTNVEIRGKVDQDNPLMFYNVVNGDTIDLFKVTGNADVIFQSNKSIVDNSRNNVVDNNTTNENSSKKENNSLVDEALNKAKEVSTKTTNVIKKDFSIWAYATFFLWGIAIIIVLGLIIWLRKQTWFISWIDKINIFKHKE